MNTLPTSVEDIIYNYLENINRDDLHDELINNFYICTECEILRNEKINHIALYCRNCDKTVCFNCPVCPMFSSEYTKDICYDCYLEEKYIEEIERITSKKLDFSDRQRFTYLLYNNEISFDIDSDYNTNLRLRVNILNFIKEIPKKLLKEDLYNFINFKINQLSNDLDFMRESYL